MSRRVTLPGADELFRKTTLAAVPSVEGEEAPVETAQHQLKMRRLREFEQLQDANPTISIAFHPGVNDMMRK